MIMGVPVIVRVVVIVVVLVVLAMCMVVSVAVRRAVIVAAAARRRGFRGRVVVPMRMIVRVIVAVRPMVVMPVVVPALVGAALGAERTLDLPRRRAEPTHHLEEHVIEPDMKHVRADLGRHVPVAEVPADLHQPERVVGPDLDQPLGRGAHLDEPAILQLHGVAVVERGRPVEIEQERETALSRHDDPPAMARLMVEQERVRHAVGLYGGTADDGGGAQHGSALVREWDVTRIDDLVDDIGATRRRGITEQGTAFGSPCHWQMR